MKRYAVSILFQSTRTETDGAGPTRTITRNFLHLGYFDANCEEEALGSALRRFRAGDLSDDASSAIELVMEVPAIEEES